MKEPRFSLQALYGRFPVRSPDSAGLPGPVPVGFAPSRPLGDCAVAEARASQASRACPERSPQTCFPAFTSETIDPCVADPGASFGGTGGDAGGVVTLLAAPPFPSALPGSAATADDAVTIHIANKAPSNLPIGSSVAVEIQCFSRQAMCLTHRLAGPEVGYDPSGG
jgi:hypothetical protein